MTNRKCKIFSIFLALTLVFASVGVAFADSAELEGYTETFIPHRYIKDEYLDDYGFSFSPNNSSFGNRQYEHDHYSVKGYGYYSFTTYWNMSNAMLTAPVSLAGDHHIKATYSFDLSLAEHPSEFAFMTAYYRPASLLGNDSARENLFEPVYGCHVDDYGVMWPDAGVDEMIFSIEGDFNIASNGIFFSYVMANQRFGTGILTCDNLYVDDIAVVQTYVPDETPIETFSFTVPYGSDLKITGKDIQTVLVRASTTKRGTLGNFFQKFNLSDIRYSAASDFEKSIPVPLSGAGKPSLTGGYSEFAGYCVPSNSFTIYNRVGNSNNISVDVYVNVTGRHIKGVYLSPQTNQDILDGVSSPTSENGDFAVTGGSGTPDDPYVTNPVNDDGVPIPYDALTPVIDNSPSDGVQNELLNRLDSIFAIPSRVASSVSGWIAGLAQLTTSLYSAFPPVITDLFVAFFSIVVLIGLVKMFL